MLTPPINARDHMRGSLNASVGLVEYGDYECPFCARAHSTVTALQQRLGDRLLFVFRHFPLPSVHPHSEQAAGAAEAAGAQGRFWQMHDLLFANWPALEEDDLIGHAAALDLDLVRFRRELHEHRYAARVQEDFHGGVRSGVNGSPTFFINGVRYDGSRDLGAMLTAMGDAAKVSIKPGDWP